VIELRLCQEHYQKYDVSVIQPDGSIPELLCKIKDVQRKLAWLQGSMETMSVVFGMWWMSLVSREMPFVLILCTSDFVVTIPFSYVAEKWGVRTVLWCNIVPRIVMSVWAIVVGMYRPNMNYLHRDASSQ